MNYKAFNNYLNIVLNAIYAQDEHLGKKDEQTFTEHGRWALNRLETVFCDKKQNLRRWLNGKPCVFTSDRTGEEIEINVGRDREALYYFLVFCYRMNTKQEIDADFRDYLAFAITRSCTADEDWEEC